MIEFGLLFAVVAVAAAAAGIASIGIWSTTMVQSWSLEFSSKVVWWWSEERRVQSAERRA